jgi:hypothetical protein
MTSGMIDPGLGPAHYRAEARREEIVSAWAAAGAAALIAFVPAAGVFRTVEAAGVLAALLAALLLAVHKPGKAEWLIGGAFVILLVVTTVAASYDLALDKGFQAAVLIRTAAATGLLVFAVARFKRAERSRRMAWGSRRIEEVERRRAWQEQLMNEDPNDPIFPQALDEGRAFPPAGDATAS